MTLVLAWSSRDQNRISSVYIAADSRITQGQSSWDSAKKVFAAKTQPLIFGYCGDVLIPSTLLAELTDSIDAGFLFRDSEPATDKWQKIHDFLQQGLKGSQPFQSSNPSEIYALNRIGTENFFAAHYVITGQDISLAHAEIYAAQTESLKVMGTGKKHYNDVFADTKNKNSGTNTARIFFASFCRALKSGAVPTVGGAPQLAVLRTRGFGKILPIKFREELWFQGMRTGPGSYPGEAFDEAFQRINPRTLNIVDGAQPQYLNP